jgi:predicted acetyltransferase
MTELFRPARSDDLRMVADLMAQSFPDRGRSRTDWEHELLTDPRGGFELFWVADAGGELRAACQLLRFEQWIAGAPIPIMGLAKVAVSAVHRRRGLGRRMITAAFARSRDRGDLASALYPFRAEFYAALGYGQAGQAIQYRLPPAALPPFTEREHFQVVRSDSQRAAVRDVYDRWIRQETGQLGRGEPAWNWFFDSPKHLTLLYRSPAGQAEGYAIVRSRSDLGGSLPALEVEERGWLTRSARRGFYGWLASIGDQWGEVIYRAHPSERIDLLLRDGAVSTEYARWGLWRTNAAVLSGPMFRLLDLPAALARRSVSPEISATVNLDVVDGQLPANQGIWHLQIADGRIHATGAAGEDADADLAISIGTLSQLYAGSISPSEAVAAGLAEIDDTQVLSELDRALRIPTPWTFTRF